MYTDHRHVRKLDHNVYFRDCTGLWRVAIISALLKDYLIVTEREVKNVADVRERETERKRESMGGYVGACGIAGA